LIYDNGWRLDLSGLVEYLLGEGREGLQFEDLAFGQGWNYRFGVSRLSQMDDALFTFVSGTALRPLAHTVCIGSIVRDYRSMI